MRQVSAKHWCAPDDYSHEGTWEHPIRTHYRIIRCSFCGRVYCLQFCREGAGEPLYIVDLPVPLGLTLLDYFDWRLRR